jgi:ABC-type Zn uptake system ZnuABC Zn-binding protein ZnuA
MLRHRHLALLVLLLGLLLGPLGPLAAQPAPPLRVATLHPILTEFAREIGGPRVEIEALVPGGVDPHTFAPTPKQVAVARAADLVLATGLHLEGFLDRIATGDTPSDRLLRVGERLPLTLNLDPAHPGCSTLCGQGEADPHWWHGIGNALFVTDLIRAEFTRLRPADADTFARHAQQLQQRLFALQAWAGARIRALPPARRHLFTTHDAFGHLARDYGFTVHPLAGYSTEAEPDARQLAALVDKVRRLGVKAVFAEDSASDRLIQALAAETGVVVPPALYADGPGAPGGGIETYEQMMRHNLGTIIDALSAR